MFSQGIKFRETGGDNTLIKRLLFSTFHGGNTPKFAPVDEAGRYTVEHAWFDNISVAEGMAVSTLTD